jgi:hypothetical protein
VSGVLTIPELPMPAAGTGLSERRRAEEYAAAGDHRMAAAYFRLACQVATRAGRDAAALRSYLKYKAHRRALLREEDRAAQRALAKESRGR